MGYRPQCPGNAANPSSAPLYRNTGMRYVIDSVASAGAADRIIARILRSVPWAGSGTAARYSSTVLGTAVFIED